MKISEKVRQLEERNKELLTAVDRFSDLFKSTQKRTIRNLLKSFAVAREIYPVDGTLPYIDGVYAMKCVTLHVTQPCVRLVKTGDKGSRAYYTNNFSITLRDDWNAMPQYNWILDSEYAIIEKVGDYDIENKRAFWIKLPTNIINC